MKNEKAAAVAFAYLTVNRFDVLVGQAQEMLVSCQGIVADGVNAPLDWSNQFTWDNTASQSVNLNNWKDQLITAAAGLGFTLTKPNIKINLQMN